MSDYPTHPNRMEDRTMRLFSATACRRGIALVGAALLGLAPAACDFEVTNPGPVQADNLNDKGAFPAIVNGMQRAMVEALNYGGLHTAAVTRELFPTGQTGQFGIEPDNSVGRLDEDEQGTPWSAGQQARWLAESGAARMEEVLGGSTDKNLAAAYLWAGYANRFLGENMCAAVIDGGPSEPPSVYLTRAKDNFTKAITAGGSVGDNTIVTAAYAGRAAVEVHQGDWPGAAADAAKVATGFKFQIKFYDTGDQYQLNRIQWSSFNQPYKAHSQWGTWYADYYDATNDPRVPYTFTNSVGTGALECCGVIPWWPQAKYTQTSPMDLSTGTEMRLVEAESLLKNDQMAAAVAKINEVRTTAGMAGVAPATMDDAWAMLKRERGIDLWLEARRLGDLRRWKANNVPGALDPKEVVGAASHLVAQDLCLPISKTERDRNPNIG